MLYRYGLRESHDDVVFEVDCVKFLVILLDQDSRFGETSGVERVIVDIYGSLSCWPIKPLNINPCYVWGSTVNYLADIARNRSIPSHFVDTGLVGLKVVIGDRDPQISPCIPLP
jgi:hypothetical protein